MPLPAKPTLLIDPPETGTGKHGYFDRLTRHPKHYRSWALRSATQINCNNRQKCGVLTIGESNTIPAEYDSVVDAMLSKVSPTGQMGTTDGEGRYLALDASGTSLLVTWDFRLDKSFAWSANKIIRHKTFAFTLEGNPHLMILKMEYKLGAQSLKGIAQVKFTANACPKYRGAGTSCNGETYEPHEADFYVQPDTWTRFWMFLDGAIGSGPVKFSAWAADETRDPVRLYNGIELVTPSAVKDFRVTFDASQEQASADVGIVKKAWTRNIAALTGATLADVAPLLVKP